METRARTRRDGGVGASAGAGAAGGGLAAPSRKTDALLEWLLDELPEIFHQEILPLLVGRGLADIARVLHVIGCHLTRETRVQTALDVVTGDVCQAVSLAKS